MATEPVTNAPNIRMLIDAEFGGYPLHVEFYGRFDQLGAVVDKMRTSGCTPPAPHQPAANGKPAAKPKPPADAPLFDDEGNDLCPHHGSVLRQGRFGLYCPSRAEGALANDKGYCRYRPE